MQADDDSIADIVLAARRAIRFVGAMNRFQFEDDELTSGAVIRQVEIVGEAAGRLSDGFRTTHPDIPWRKVVGMRNVLIHSYERVDLSEVWRVVTQEFPSLVEMLEVLLPPPPDNP